jgi:acyl-CoA thioesterase-1
MGNYVEEFEKLFAEVAAEQKVPLVPFLLAGVGGVPELNLPDGIHPTPEGHRKIATNVFRVLKPILEKQVSDQSAPKENHTGVLKTVVP